MSPKHVNQTPMQTPEEWAVWNLNINNPQRQEHTHVDDVYTAMALFTSKKDVATKELSSVVVIRNRNILQKFPLPTR